MDPISGSSEVFRPGRGGRALAANGTHSAPGTDSIGDGEAMLRAEAQMQAAACGRMPPPELNPLAQPQGINLTTPVEVKSRHKHSRSASFSGRPSQEPFGSLPDGLPSQEPFGSLPEGRVLQSEGRSVQSEGRAVQSEGRGVQSEGRAVQSEGRGGQSEGRSVQSEVTPRKRTSRLLSRRGSGVGAHSLEKVLGSHNLLKDLSPRTPRTTPSSSEGPEDLGDVDNEGILGESFSLKRVPSYSNSSGSDPAARHARALSSVLEPGRRRITILSMDGGGMRGLIAARCLAHLESLIQSKTGEQVKLCEYFDFLAGTSTGAILTMMISTPDKNGDPLFTGQGCCQFYARNGKNIFRPRWYDPWRGSIRQFYRPKYSPRRFEKLLKHYLVRDGRELTMRDTLKPFLVTSFDISRATPHIFVRHAAMKDDSRNFRLWEVCRGTASAPTYFKPAEVISMDGKNRTTLIDGGAIQNNPALVAMTHVLGNNEEFPEAVGLNDLLILSLGAGQLDETFDLKKAKKWGMAGWVRPLLNIMMDGSSDTIDYQLAAGFAGHNCSENYLRIQPSGLPRKTSLMDCATRENIHDLIQFTDDLLQEKAVMRNEFGEKVIHPETYAERLSWFADQLIHQKKLREKGATSIGTPLLPNHKEPGMGPTSRVVSPMYGHLFMHQQLHHNGMSRPLETAKSVRF